MKKIKELWGENKVLIVLGIILIICLIAIIVVTFSFFLGGSKGIYGNRLDGIDEHKITETLKSDYVSTLKEEKSINNVIMNVSGKILYITIDFVSDTSLEEAKGKATSSLDKIPGDIQDFYDISFILTCAKSENSEGFTIMGAKNVSGSGLVWNNNTPIEEEE